MTIWIRDGERKLIDELLEEIPRKWPRAADFVHEAIMEKLHKEGKRLRPQ